MFVTVLTVTLPLTLPTEDSRGILQAALGRDRQKSPYTLKTTTSTRGIAIALTFIVFFANRSPPLMPVWYAHEPCPSGSPLAYGGKPSNSRGLTIVRPLSISDQAEYLGCRDFSVLG